jgi:hypothetical protein
LPLNGRVLMWSINDAVEASGDTDELFTQFHLAASTERSPIMMTSTLLIDLRNLLSRPRSTAICVECLTL